MDQITQSFPNPEQRMVGDTKELRQESERRSGGQHMWLTVPVSITASALEAALGACESGHLVSMASTPFTHLSSSQGDLSVPDTISTALLFLIVRMLALFHHDTILCKRQYDPMC